MDYQKIYNSLIGRAKDRTPFPGFSYERHHIIPRCLGGDNSKENIAILTPEEHYVAHQLLVKIYPDNRKLIKAANIMTTGKHRNNKLYGWLKRRHSESMRGENNSFYGKTHTPESLEKMRLGNLGKVRTQEAKDKISASKLGRPRSEEYKKSLSKKRKGCYTPPHSEESKKKISQSRLQSSKVHRIKIQTPDGIFDTIKSAAEFYNVDPGTISNRCRKLDGWHRMDRLS